MCGVVGLIGTNDAAREAFLGLTTLQHRGQDAAGILTYGEDGFHRVKNLGMVENVFDRDNIETLRGSMAIGHARYSTVGRGEVIEVQPFLLSYPFGLGMAHNGNVVNIDSLASELRKKSRRHLLTSSDLEVILNLVAESLSQSLENNPSEGDGEGEESERLSFDQICQAIGTVYSKVNGSYSVVTLIADHGLLAFRDPHGIRPLVWGKRDQGTLPDGSAYMVASESVALNFNGYHEVQNLEPGEVLFIDLQGKVHRKVLKGLARRHCMFEWVYFASPESEIDGAPVYGARIGLGKRLAHKVASELKKRNAEVDLIVPVPETARIAAIALAEELKVPYRETLIKNRYIKRTFILDSQDKREKAVNLKLSPVRSEIEGKNVLLVDDSIVRGTTSRKLVELVRKAGAKKVYFVSTCPPIQHPCYYGIDFPEESELIAHGRTVEEIEKAMGADVVIYQDIEGLLGGIRDASKADIGALCKACLDNQYPTDVSSGVRFAAARRMDRRNRT